MEFVPSAAASASCGFSTGDDSTNSGASNQIQSHPSSSCQSLFSPSTSSSTSISPTKANDNSNSSILTDISTDKEYLTQVSTSSQHAVKHVEEVSSSLECALDNLATYLHSSFSLSGDMHEKMAMYLQSEDVSQRLEATQAYRRSLSHRQDLEKRNSGSSQQRGLSSRRVNNGSSSIDTDGAFSPGSERGPLTSPVLDVTIDDMLRANLVPQVIRSLTFPHPHLQIESVFLLQRLCRGTAEQTKEVVNGILVSALVELLDALDLQQQGGPELRIAVLSLITKLAEDYKIPRDAPLRSSAVLHAVLQAAEMRIDIEGVRCVQALVVNNVFNFVTSLKPFIAYLSQVLQSSEDPSTLCLACNACVTLCERQEGVTPVVDSKAIVPRVIQLSQHDDQQVVFDALSVIAKIAFVGTTTDIDKIIAMGVVPAMVDVLRNPLVSNSTTRARTCNAIGNIGCETPKQVQTIIESEALPLLMDIFLHDPDYNTRTEAAYSVCTCVSRSCPSQVWYIISCTSRPMPFPSYPSISSKNSRTNNLSILSFEGSNPCLQLIADMLEMVCGSDPNNASSLKLCKAILRGLDNILSVGVSEGKRLGMAENPYATMFHEVQGDLKLSQMQFFPEYCIAAKTHIILEKYFSTGAIWSSKG